MFVHRHSCALVAAGLGLTLLFAGRNVAQDTAVAADQKLNRRDVEAALEKKLTFEFVETPLAEVVDFLEARLEINVQLDQKSLDDAGVSADTPITRNVSDLSARSQLNLLLHQLDLTYLVEDGVLVITTPEKACAVLRTVVYPVEDLIHGSNDFGEPVRDYNSLTSLITANVFPTTWSAVGGPASISTFDGRLAISQTDEGHRPIAILLDTIRELRDAAPDAPRPPSVSLEQKQAENDAIRKKLDATVSLQFAEVPLSDIADHLRRSLKISLQLDAKALDDAGVGSDTPLRL